MGSTYGGYMGRVLWLDLACREVADYPWSDADRELYLGGKIMAAKILCDNLAGPIDPFDAANLLVVTTGPLNGSGAPSSSRFNISTVSPLTGLLASSNCGGDFGLHLKKAGYDALIISGRAPAPTWLEINEDAVHFHSAVELWGLTTSEVQEHLGPGSGKIVIGPAGENLVRYAAIVSGERFAGRAGVGAVMGSKNLKAVVAQGAAKVPIADPGRAKRVFRGWLQQLREHPLTGKQLPDLGTAGLLSGMHARRILATRNFQFGRFPGFEEISGETLAEKYLVKRRGCPSCPIQCGRVVRVNGKEVKGPELETLGLLGANLENDNLERILAWNVVLDDFGLDTISTGNTLGFAMELQERGLWDNGLRFGDTVALEEIFRDIAYRRGLGDLLAEGTQRLSARFGGKEFAMHVKGLELPAYEPRAAVGQGLGYAVANRGGCHLNAGYLVLLEGLGLHLDPRTAKAKPALTMLLQNLMETASAGGSCLFTLFAVLPGVLLSRPNGRLARLTNQALRYTSGPIRLLSRLPKGLLAFNLPILPHVAAIRAVTGMPMNLGRFLEVGERGYNLERLLNLRLGLTAAADTLPARLLREPQDPQDPGSTVPLAEMRSEYYRLRGWDQDGRPTAQTLRRLRLE